MISLVSARNILLGGALYNLYMYENIHVYITDERITAMYQIKIVHIIVETSLVDFTEMQISVFRVSLVLIHS